MVRYLWKGHVAEGRLAEYRKRHDEIWPEMLEMMKNAGISNYTIWNNGNELIGYYEMEDPEKKKRVYQDYADTLARWNESMEGLMRMDSGPDGKPITWEQVFLME